MNAVQRLEEEFPWIRWREPVGIVVHFGANHVWYACRVCIAVHGLVAREIADSPYAFETRALADQHIREEHPE